MAYYPMNLLELGTSDFKQNLIDQSNVQRDKTSFVLGVSGDLSSNKYFYFTCPSDSHSNKIYLWHLKNKLSTVAPNFKNIEDEDILDALVISYKEQRILYRRSI